MANVARGDDLTAADEFHSLADKDSVHDDGIAWCKIVNGELVFCKDGRDQRTFALGKVHGGAARQVLKRNKDVVARIKPQNAFVDYALIRHCSPNRYASAHALPPQDAAIQAYTPARGGGNAAQTRLLERQKTNFKPS